MFFRVLFAAVAAMKVGLAVSQAAPIPGPTLFQDDYVTTMALSPDGTRIATLIKNDGEDIIVVIDLETVKPIQRIPMGDYPATSLRWASSSHLLVGVALLEEYGGVTYRTNTRMLSVEVETGKFAVMFDSERRAMRRNRWLGQVANLLPSDPDHILMPASTSSGNHLWRVNVRTGEAEITEKGRSRTVAWFTESSGRAVLRVDASRTYRYLRIYARRDEEEWEEVRSVRVRRDDDEERDFWPVAPAPGEDQYYVLAHPEDEEFSTIKLYDYTTDEFVETVIEAEGADIQSALTSSATGDLLGARVQRDRYETILLDTHAQAHIKGLDAFFDNDANVRFWGGSEDGRYALLYVTAPTMPGAFYTYDYEQANAIFLMNDKKGIDKASLGAMEIVSYAARDGETLTAYVTHPPGVASDKPAPLVVLVHGGPEARDAYDFDRQVQYLASRGYRVLQPYFRGSSGRGRRFAEAGYGQWGGLMQDDVTDAVRHLSAQGLAEPSTTCIVGASYGGYAALYGGATTPELYACVASLAGVTDLRDQVRFDGREHGRDSEVYDYIKRGIGDPKADREKLDRTSPIAFAENYPLPVHLAHGEDDDVVPAKQSRDFAKALAKAGRPHEYHEYENEGHTFEEWETDQAYMASLAAFLAENIGGDPAP